MTGSLFGQDAEPLAARMRPRTLDEFVGQEHILGPGRLLRRSIQADMLSSLIFYGPPGTGKTTLARVIANTTRSDFISLNAVLSGVKDVRIAIDKAKDNLEFHDRRTILFVDEVHRWNKAQQDALLPWVENGTVILIGATTHNPFFEVNSALVSRSRIFQLKPLSDADLRAIVRNVITDRSRGYGRFSVDIDPDALDHLVSVSNGDARALLGALQLAVETTADPFPPPDGTVLRIDRSVAEDSIQKKAVLYDKEGDIHFDVISAFIKSIRGSDPDAALYWMARMIHSGEDPRFIFRRMLISASEDVGLADPYALTVVEAAAASFDRVGLPEGRFFLAHAALYLATCPKSNSTLGFFDALGAIEHEDAGEVPNHLRDASRDKEGFGHGEGYLYPHAYRDHWVAQAYLPDSLRGRVFYQPGDQGYEERLRNEVLERRELQLELGFREESAEVLSYSRDADRQLESWISRTERGTAAVAELRDRTIAAAAIERHHRLFIAGRNPSLVVWSALRRAPEGLVAAWFGDRRRAEIAAHHARETHPLLSPIISLDDATVAEFVESKLAGAPDLAGVRFDRVILTDPGSLPDDPAELAVMLHGASAPAARLVVVHRTPGTGLRLSELVPLDDGQREILARAEDELYGRIAEIDRQPEIVRQLEAQGWTIGPADEIELAEPRHLAAELLETWFRADRDGLGSTIARISDDEELKSISEVLIRELAGQEITWPLHSTIIVARNAE